MDPVGKILGTSGRQTIRFSDNDYDECNNCGRPLTTKYSREMGLCKVCEKEENKKSSRWV